MASPLPDLKNRLVGNYRLVGFLGQGGFASVYLGEHVNDKSQVAIKFFVSLKGYGQTNTPSNEALKALQDEARIISRLNYLQHPHIIRISDIGMESGISSFPQGIPYMVMDYAPYGSAFHFLKNALPLPVDQVVTFIGQVASALYHAHNLGILHRDVKPPNLLFAKQNHILLADFGIARILRPGSLEHETTLVKGSLEYMPPEQFQSKTYPASDQYALGIIAYQWLTGVKPFIARDPLQIMNAHASTPPAPLRQHQPSLPLAVERVVLQALEKDWHNRFPSVLDFANALAAAAQGPQQFQSYPPPLPLNPTPSIYWPSGQTGQQGATSTVLGGSGGSQPLSTIPSDLNSHAPDGTRIAFFRTNDKIKEIHWLNNGYISAVTVNNQLYVWNANSEQNHSITPIQGTRWTRSPNNSYLAILGSNQVEIYDVLQQQMICTYAQKDVSSVVWSPDGEWIASAGTDGQKECVHIWQARTGLRRLSLITKTPLSFEKHIRKITLLAWSPDGNRIVSCDVGGTIYVWNPVSAEIVCTPPQGLLISDTLTDLLWSPDGQFLAFLEPRASIQVWDVWKTQDGADKDAPPGPSPQLSNWTGHYSPSSITHYPAYLYDYPLLLWRPSSSIHHTATQRQRARRVRENNFLAFLTDPSTVEVWDITSHKRISQHPCPVPVNALAWSPNGKALAVGGEEGIVEIWNPWTGNTIQRTHHAEPNQTYQVQAIGWSPNGYLLASGAGDPSGGEDMIWIWQARRTTDSVSHIPDTPPQVFPGMLDVNLWLALLLGAFDIAFPGVVGIYTSSLFAFFVIPLLAVLAIILTVAAMHEWKQGKPANNKASFQGLVFFFSAMWGLTFLVIGSSIATGVVETLGGVIGLCLGAAGGWIIHRSIMRTLYRRMRDSYQESRAGSSW